MPFTTIDFWSFFAVVVTGYYVFPKRIRWWILLAGSLFFYGWLSPIYLVFMAATIAISYSAAMLLDLKNKEEEAWIERAGKSMGRDEKKIYRQGMNKKRTRILAVALLLLLSMLFVFKYLDFAIDNVSWLMKQLGIAWNLPRLGLILPIGLSFYLFQSIGYIIDVQRGEVLAERNFFKHALFVSYFPQIMQGPIGNYSRLSLQLFAERDFDYGEAVSGIRRAAWGLFKKFMIANRLGYMLGGYWEAPETIVGFFPWIFICACYAIELYADFSGYMDIACGCSQMLGIKLDENFNCPYFSRSIPEFWRRWHMTLCEWFRSYLFYPILRSDGISKLRRSIKNKYLSSVLPTSAALTAVWLATGLWHGANWGYVAWGGYYGLFMIASVALAPLMKKLGDKYGYFEKNVLWQILRAARTFVIVCIGYAIFKPADLSKTVCIFNSMVASAGLGEIGNFLRGQVAYYGAVGVASLLVFAIDGYHFAKPGVSVYEKMGDVPWPVRWGLYMLFMIVVVFMGLYGASFDTFEYYKF